MCVDYRMLNTRSVKDAYALPKIEEIFDVLQGSKYFSTIDMKSGYHQVEVEESHKERTAFSVANLGFYEYVKMPFGLTNSPATYQRLMEECLGDLNMTICVIYLDDLIIFSDTFEEHLRRLNLVLTRLKECNLKLSPEKCFFIQDKVPFLGHIVSKDGIETDPAKIEKIRKWPTPTNYDELRSFLAFCGYYRRFIKDFSKITRPLAEMLPPTVSKRKIPTKPWIWTENEQTIFENLKEILTKPPVLAYPDFTKPFELHTDASGKGLGAVLYQSDRKLKRVIAYASRALTKSEKNYNAYKLEFLALKWAVTEKFSDYLTMNHFTVLTDNNPLTYVLKTAKLDATGQRWASALGEYNFDIKYRPGMNNSDADAMSRYPNDKMDEKTDTIKEIRNDVVKAICSNTDTNPLIETICANINIIESTEDSGQPMAQIELRELRRQQRQDKCIDRWRIATLDKRIPTRNLTKDDYALRKTFNHLVMKRGVLYRKVQQEGGILEQLVLPECYRKEVLKGLHDDVGHPGRDRTISLIRDRFFWPGMTKDIETWIEGCDRCIRRKSGSDIKAPLVNVNTTYPLELVCMDYLTLEQSKGGISNILVITDHFTKYAMAIPTRNQTAKTTAEAFYNNFILHYGIPTRIHSDQGTNFESTIIKELCNLTGMEKTRTSIYHPQGNAGPERYNRTLLGMLGTLQNEQKANWSKYINSLVYAYNCTPQSSTKYSPFEIMFGRRPKLPIDIMFEQIIENQNRTTKEYVEDLKDRMETTRKLVQNHLDKAKEDQKNYYDQKARAAKLYSGDRVLVKVLAFEGKHKIQDKFEGGTYIVVDQPNEEIPVYRVRSEVSDVVKTLHRNHLFPIGDKLLEKGAPIPKKRFSIERRKKNEEEVATKKENRKKAITGEIDRRRVEHEKESSDSDEEDTEFVVFTNLYGDAHNPREEENNDRRGESQAPEEQSREETREESVTGIEEVTEENRTERSTSNENIAEETNTENSREDSERERTETEQFLTSTEGNTQNSVAEEQIPPKPPPRRSQRERRKPVWYDTYQMNQMVHRTQDSKLDALNILMSSGILQQIDRNIAHNLLDTIIK